MIKITAIAVMALNIMTTSAEADWQYTKWGMTAEEVITASNNKASKPKKPDTVEDGHIVHLLTAPYSTERFNFKSQFWFGKISKKLEIVKLGLVNIDQCPSLIGELKSIYGNEYFKKLSFGEIYKWRDTKNKNDILLMNAENLFCELSYQNIINPGERGL